MTLRTQTAQKTLSPQFVELLNATAKDQPDINLTALDLCDRCSKGAKSEFTFAGHSTPLRFCGNHTRFHLQSLLEAEPASFQIAAEDLWLFKGVNVPERDSRRAGDGLTDA